MHIGLYDIDLHHGAIAFPNLELMKIYNYYYKQGIPVTMARPRDDFGRFSKIIFFKDSPNVRIPNSLSLSGDNKIYYGYGFYKKVGTLPDSISAATPTFLPYDAYSNKIKDYEKIRRNSLYRLENDDRTGINDSTRLIYIVDREPLYQKNLIPFLLEPHKQKIKFFHRLEVKDEVTYEKFKSYHHLLDTSFYINFDFSKDFFTNHCDKDFEYNCAIREKESIKQYTLRILSMILIKKHFGARVTLNFINPKTELLQLLIKWNSNKIAESFSNCYADNAQVKKIISVQESEIRMLLKQNPKTLNIEYLDF